MPGRPNRGRPDFVDGFAVERVPSPPPTYSPQNPNPVEVSGRHPFLTYVIGFARYIIGIFIVTLFLVSVTSENLAVLLDQRLLSGAEISRIRRRGPDDCWFRRGPNRLG